SDACLVGIETTVELCELWVFSEGFCIDPVGLRIALTADFLGIAVSVGYRDLALAIGRGTNGFAFSRICGAQFVGHALTFCLHAAINRLRDGFHIIRTRDAHIDDVHTPGLFTLDGLQYFTLDVFHQRLTPRGDQFTYRSAV